MAGTLCIIHFFLATALRNEEFARKLVKQNPRNLTLLFAVLLALS
jgi:hypothetical protein